MEKRFRITVDGREYIVAVEDLSEGAGQLYPQPGSMSIAPPPAAASVAAAPVEHGPAGAGDVTSSLAGVVESILVSVGQQVSQGDKVAIIEAMKMKSPMIALRAGRVAAIAVKAGDTVDAGQVLVSLG
jgi:biotin carboxyl carrier protein